MELSERIVAAARGWIGTHFCHQGRRKKQVGHGGGVDCLGLLVGVAAECGLSHGGQWLAALDERDYGHFPDRGRLRGALEHYLQPVSVGAIAAGDVLLLRVDGLAQHVGIVGDYAGGELSLIHAYAPARAVVEHRLDGQWQGQIEAAFRFTESSLN